MMRNAAETTSSEAAHLVTIPFLLHMIVFGMIPVFLICWVQVVHLPFLSKVKWNLIAILPLVLVALAFGFSSARSIAAVTRLHRDLMLTFNPVVPLGNRSEEHTSELQSLIRISYAVFCLKKKKNTIRTV